QTELRRQQEEVAQRTAMLQALLDSLADAVAIADHEGTLVLCNSGFRTLFECDEDFAKPGLRRADFIRHRLARGILYPHERASDDPAMLVERLQRRLADAGGNMAETVRLRDRWLDVRRRLLPDGGVVSSYMDITARIETDQARRAQREALREAQRMGATASLLAGVAHELNNPLSVVAAQATLLEAEAEGTALAARAGKVSEAARRCGRIVTSLLASANRRAPRREPVALRDALASALDLMALRLQAAAVEATVRLPRRLPAVLGDADQIAHLVANLVSNAVAVLAGRPDPRRVMISAESDGTQVTLRIADNGPGIPEAMRERVFDPFFTTRPGGVGTGVGLALCRTIAQDHGGQILAEETPGGGATIVVRLPAQPARPAARQGDA
ncbi:MAG: PAS domain-containing sensor histidine kinase, partial [Acetobacteraceae bacterium]|nr:PAS domain-containing sensor histidine kinase [Acetobacteraceae bacterium]